MSVGGTPPTWAPPSGSLNDARHRAGSTTRADGLKVHAAKSGGENVVGAVLFGTYWFARSVNELSARSRLASPRSTTTVETDHPLLSSHSRALPRSAAPGPTLYSRTGLPATPRRRACPHASSRIDRRDRSAVERCSDHPKHHRARAARRGRTRRPAPGRRPRSRHRPPARTTRTTRPEPAPAPLGQRPHHLGPRHTGKPRAHSGPSGATTR